jgi:hypothetical protein
MNHLSTSRTKSPITKNKKTSKSTMKKQRTPIAKKE